MTFTKQSNETYAQFRKRIDDFEKKLWRERIDHISKGWDYTNQLPGDHPPATDEERAAAREVIGEVTAAHKERDEKYWASDKPTHWVYKGGGKYYFNSADELPDCDSFSEAVQILRDKYEYSTEDHQVRLCRSDGTQLKTFGLWESQRKPVPPRAWQQVGDLARRATPKQPRYRAGEDPQAERAILMRLHGLSFEEAQERWPLSEYAQWRRAPFA